MPPSSSLAIWPSGQGHDALHACDVGLHSAPDTAIIGRAKQDARTVVTADLDYPRLLAQSTEPSLVLFRNGDWSDADVVRRMKDELDAIPESELATSIVVVDRYSIRRRRLPLR